jgi:nucleoside-diphosphate-sugar epimerase
MRVLVAGASGDLGRALVRTFAASGDDVIGLVRSEASVAMVRALGGEAFAGDLYDAAQVAARVGSVDVVIHAVTAIPRGSVVRSARSWEANDRARTAGTRALTEVAARAGAHTYLQQSVAWVVRRAPGDPAYDVDTPADPPRLLMSAVEGERIARAAGARHGFAVGVLRGGAFYGADTAQSRGVADQLRRRALPVIGRGDSLVAPIHVDDMAAACLRAARLGRSGTWHIVDDSPLPFGDLLRHFASAIGAPPPRRMPRWLAKLALGEDALEALTSSMQTSNARARRELAWAPAHADVRAGSLEMAAEWQGEARRAA